ncbi:small integral membrane protein 12 isoform X2 [Melanerpes formicivorus]|uniref:small integral membrane protein 12 isoform X2 n=1 Tax=Melanerpes formicivorus TaxID=211600 RepID=UPI00358EAA9B
MWSVVWAAVRSKAPYVTFPVAFVVGLVGYHLEWFLRGDPQPAAEEKSISEQREDRKLQEIAGKDLTKVWFLPWCEDRRNSDLSDTRSGSG